MKKWRKALQAWLTLKRSAGMLQPAAVALLSVNDCLFFSPFLCIYIKRRKNMVLNIFVSFLVVSMQASES